MAAENRRSGNRVKHYREKLNDLMRCFFPSSGYSAESFDANYVLRLHAYELTANCRADLDAVIGLIGPRAGLKVLDYGCGIGTLRGELSRLGCDVTGADASGEILAAARTRHPAMNFTPLEEAPADNDVVVSTHVLGHVPDPRRLLRDMHALLVPGGRLVMLVPNPAYTMGMLPANLMNDYCPDPTVQSCWSKSRIARELKDAGFTFISLRTTGEFPPHLKLAALRSRIIGEAVRESESMRG
jgi:2-polyprenyl-3-methyl-5-hydroxy-6-metoxy-1,4-benzoquinol methylase